VATTGVCGNPEVVEHGVNGLLVPPRDAAALTAALARLLADPALQRRFVEAGLSRMDRFARERTFGEVERALAAVAGA
jgi:glycosyltransferase involved in cell wall biosynthesis